MPKKVVKTSSALLVTPVVLVTCRDEGVKDNIITLAWVGVASSEPPMISIGIRPDRHSHAMIKKSGEFAVNVPPLSILKEMDYCGVASGKNVDKFSTTGLTQVPAAKIKAPLIRECPINLECLVRQLVSLGSHDLFLGEVVAAHIDEEIRDEKGKIDGKKFQPFVFIAGAGEYWSLAGRVGGYGFTKGKLE
jgi:flavin reductase (DIM6/NTAB) family NADH-FMN oxidoreductase RutF